MTDKPPFMPTGLDHLLLQVTDMDAALAFYTKIVGCNLITPLPQFGMAELSCGVALVDTSTAEGAWAKEGPAGGTNLHHFCVALAPCPEATVRDHLSRHAIAIEEERLENGKLSFYIRDPSGNQVELRFTRG